MQNENLQNTEASNIERKPFSHLQKLGVLVGITLIVLIVIAGLLSRKRSSTALGETTERAATPIVNVISVAPTKEQNDLVLPGNTQPFNDAAIYARTDGYLKRWYVDIGAHVHQGQVLAEIETPELDRQLEQARADLRTAQENEQLAQTTADRWQKLLKDDAVSQQETDQYNSDLQAKKSTLDSAKANAQRLEQLQSFEKVEAPFAGVITARNTDIGDLINAGSGSAPKELFHIAAVARLRVYVTFPESDSALARNGAQVDLTLDEYPNKIFKGTIVRNADAIDLSTRTLKVEIDVDNKKDRIKTGAYVRAHFKANQKSVEGSPTLTVPANTLLFRSEGLRVAVVHGDQAELVPITIGRDFGSSLEVLFGLSVGDKVVLNPSDSLASGTHVRVATGSGASAR